MHNKRHTHDAATARVAAQTYKRVGQHNENDAKSARTMAARPRNTQHNVASIKDAAAVTTRPRGRAHDESALKHAIRSPIVSSSSSTGGKAKQGKSKK